MSGHLKILYGVQINFDVRYAVEQSEDLQREKFIFGCGDNL